MPAEEAVRLAIPFCAAPLLLAGTTPSSEIVFLLLLLFAWCMRAVCDPSRPCCILVYVQCADMCRIHVTVVHVGMLSEDGALISNSTLVCGTGWFVPVFVYVHACKHGCPRIAMATLITSCWRKDAWAVGKYMCAFLVWPVSSFLHRLLPTCMQ